MNTKIFKIDKENDLENLIQAGEIIKEGGLVAFPTETVYGLGGDALNKESSEKIYKAKGRPSDNPLIVHVAKKEDIEFIVKNMNDNAKKLIDEFMPGPITIIMDKKDIVPKETTGGLDTVAVRMPSHEIARSFIRHAGGYVAAPSANISGRPSPTNAMHVNEDLGGIIEGIIDDGHAVIGLESTIVDATVNPVQILRPGYITKEDIEKVLGNCTYDPALISITNDVKPKAPGMKYRHYAPKASMTIYDGDIQKVKECIVSKACKDLKEGKKVAVIGTSENESYYIEKLNNRNFVFKNIGPRELGLVISENLYKILRELDRDEIEMCYSEAFYDVLRSPDSQENIGIAIMNRLSKAAGQNIVKV